MVMDYPGSSIYPEELLAVRIVTGLTLAVDQITASLESDEQEALFDGGYIPPYMSGAARLVGQVADESVDWLLLGQDLGIVAFDPTEFYRLKSPTAEVLLRRLERRAWERGGSLRRLRERAPELFDRLIKTDKSDRTWIFTTALDQALEEVTEERLAYIQIVLDRDGKSLHVRTRDLYSLMDWLEGNLDAPLPEKIAEPLEWLFEGADSSLRDDWWPSYWRSNPRLDRLISASSAGAQLVKARHETERLLQLALETQLAQSAEAAPGLDEPEPEDDTLPQA